MDSTRLSAAPWASSLTSTSTLTKSPNSRAAPFANFGPSQFYGNAQEEERSRGGFNTSLKLERTSFDHHGPLVDGEGTTAPFGTMTATSLFENHNNALDRTISSTLSVLLLRRLSTNMSQEALDSMLLFASDMVDAQFLPPHHQLAHDRGFQAAVARFSTYDGALEVRNRLNGKPNASGDATMVLQVIQGATLGETIDFRRRASDAPSSGRHLSTSGSSVESTSNGQPNKSSRFSNTFQAMDNPSSQMKSSSRSPGHLDLSGTQFSTTHIQNLFSPTSPVSNSLNDLQYQQPQRAQSQRISGRSMLGDDTGDEETRELLQDPLRFVAEDDQRHRDDLLSSQLGNLRLETTNGTEHSTNGVQTQHSYQQHHPITSPRSAAFSSRHNHSTTTATAQQQVQSPPSSSDFSPNYSLSPLSPVSSNYSVGSPQYLRHQFPPANPADQNPPCNTLYVGNLPMDTAEEELKDLFSKQRGYKRLCFRTKHNGPMCFVEFEDISFATKALYELYGHLLSNSVRNGIRLSFSKNPLGVRTGQSNMHSPLSPQLGSATAGYGSLGGNGVVPNGGVLSSPPFSTANGPPPGLSMPPGLNGSLPLDGGAGQSPFFVQQAASDGFRGGIGGNGQNYSYHNHQHHHQHHHNNHIHQQSNGRGGGGSAATFSPVDGGRRF